MRKFAFQKAETVEDEFKVTGDTVGSIMVQMSYGKLQKRVLGSSSATADLARSSQAVAEKEAAKTGKSIKVDRQGEKMKMSKTRSRYHIPSSHHAGTFIVFIREQFWMQSRQLIDADGQPVMQTGDAPAIVIDDDRDDEGENEVGSKRKTPEGSGNALEKKAKLDSNAVDNPTT